MFKGFKKNDKFLTLAIYIFLVGLALILSFFIIKNFGRITSFAGSIINAMMAFVYGFVIAFICNPLYKKLYKHVFGFVEKKKPHKKLRKGLSIFTTYLILFLVIALFLLIALPQIFTSVTDLITNISTYVGELSLFAEDLVASISKSLPFLRLDAQETINSLLSFITYDKIVALISNVAVGAVKQVFSIIVGLILSVYFLIFKEGFTAKIKKLLCAVLKKDKYEKVVDFGRFSYVTFTRYVVGALLDSILVGVVIFLLLTIFGFDMAPLIAVICGVTNIIPFFGPFLGAIPSGIIILMVSGDITKVIGFAIIILVVQQIDGNLIAPHVLGNATGLTPVGVIASVTFCSFALGFVGMVIGVPLCACIGYIFSNIIGNKLKKKKLPIKSEYYQVKDVYTDENFKQARFAVEAEAKLKRDSEIEQMKNDKKLKDDFVEEIKDKVIEKLLSESLESIKQDSSKPTKG